jgi:hypothetical protein
MLDSSSFDMAERTGIEPATSYVTGRRSNQLNYRSIYSHETLKQKFNTFILVGAEGFEPPTPAV